MKISFAMACYNRLEQLLHTLGTINNSAIKNGHDVEICLVDDASNEYNRLDAQPGLNGSVAAYPRLSIKVLRINPEDKWWRNPCIATNKALAMATGDIIFLQNPECYHVGDLITQAINTIELSSRHGIYICFSTYAANPDYTLRLTNFEYGQVPPLVNTVPWNNPDEVGWYQHPIYRNAQLNFCTAMDRTALDIMKGFDEEFAYGIGYDDNEFVHRLHKNHIRVITPDESIGYAVHLWHQQTFYYDNELAEMNKRIFARKVGTL